MTLRQHGLHDFVLEWCEFKDRLGEYEHGAKSVRLAPKLIKSFAVFNEVLLHEIAHALDYRERGTTDHGDNWKKWCRKVGCPARALIPTRI